MNKNIEMEGTNMKKIMAICVVIGLVGIAGIVIASNDNGESAPQTGENVPIVYDPPQGPQGNGPGPAPNSGDGIPDGPGW